MQFLADERPGKYLSINRVNLDVANQIMINGIRRDKLLSYRRRRRRGSELREEFQSEWNYCPGLRNVNPVLVFRGGFRAG